jgi:hypothetical protein
MKKTLICIAAICAMSIGHSIAAVSFGGTALSGNFSGTLAIGDRGILVNSDDGGSFTLFNGTLNSGISLTSISSAPTNGTTLSVGGSNFTIFGNNTATAVGNPVMTGAASFNIASSTPANLAITQGDSFAYIVFENSTTTTIAGDTFRIWRASNWTIPADGSSNNFGSFATQITTANQASNLIGTYQVVPEPSTYALLAIGAVGLFLSFRRRKVQA